VYSTFWVAKEEAGTQYWLGPLVLSQVCSLWRTITTGSTSIWASVVFDIRPGKTSLSESSFAWEKWLARAGDSPLSASIIMAGLDTSHERLGSVVKLLRASQSRWRAIAFCNPPSTCPDSLFMLPALEEYFVRVSPSYTGDPTGASWLNPIHRISSLRILSLECNYRTSTLRSRIASSCLQEVRLGTSQMTWSDIYMFLQSQLGLRIFQVGLLQFDSRDPDLPRFVHESLHTLLFPSTFDRTLPEWAFSSLSFPNLTTCALPRLLTDLGASIEGFLARSPKLRNLYIRQEWWGSRSPQSRQIPHPVQHLTLWFDLDDFPSHSGIDSYRLDTLAAYNWLRAFSAFMQQPAFAKTLLSVDIYLLVDRNTLFNLYGLTILCDIIRRYSVKIQGGSQPCPDIRLHIYSDGATEAKLRKRL
ncbi:hypothetical protein DL96DRAFT_1606121, partial [Flagelloscypha sp. PMI_526]